MTDEEIKAMLDQFRQIALVTLCTIEVDRRRASHETGLREP